VPIIGTIETTGDKDWYRFTPNVSGTWVFTASKPAMNPLTDSIGTVYLSNGTNYAVSNHHGAGDGQFRAQAQLTAGQVYSLEVSASDSVTGNYTITATRS